MKVYLAGDFYTGWQDIVKGSVPQHEYFDPMIDADQRYPFQFVQQDLEGVRWCDVLFAYFSLSNPSGVGLAIEMGWAVMLGKKIILIDPHDEINTFMAACCKRLFTKLRPAIDCLKEME